MTGLLGRVRTKIVATVGPASRDRGRLLALAGAGVDVFRLNFSHGTHEEQAEALARIRSVESEVGRPLAVLQDLGGPKLRLGPLAAAEPIECQLGEIYRLVVEPTGSDPRELTCTYRDLPRDLAAGDPVLFADGAVAMAVVDVDARLGVARLAVTLAGPLRSRQGLNLPGARLRVGALTPKDLVDLDWTARSGVEYVGLSFVRRADDIDTLRRELDARGSKARIVAKIEKPEAVADLDAIVERADAVMVARGDLGVEMDVAAVPAIQKRIIAACHRARVPVITATQMLSSMESSSRPTRAEASDVFNAVLDGTDAVMLSGETAIGRYPVEAVATMARIVAGAEAYRPGPDAAPFADRSGWITPVTEAVVEAAGLACRRLGAALLVVGTRTGRTALAASKHRNATPTLALTDDPGAARAMALYWGVTPLVSPVIADADEALEVALRWAGGHGFLRKGDRVVLVRGTIPGDPTHNALLVREVE